MNKTDNVLIYVILKLVRVTKFYSIKAVGVTYSDCVFLALVIQHAMRMYRIILLSVASSALPHCYT